MLPNGCAGVAVGGMGLVEGVSGGMLIQLGAVGSMLSCSGLEGVAAGEKWCSVGRRGK